MRSYASAIDCSELTLGPSGRRFTESCWPEVDGIGRLSCLDLDDFED